MLDKITKKERGLNVTGSFEVITYKAGTKEEIKPRIKSKNLVVNNSGSGVQLLLDKITGLSTGAVIKFIRLGTGTTAVVDADNSLEIPKTTGGDDDDGYHDVTFIQNNGDNRILEFFMSDQSLTDDTYKEIGVFFEKGEMYARSLFPVDFSKAAGEDKQINYQLTFNNS
jgi:hypothetical protein